MRSILFYISLLLCTWLSAQSTADTAYKRAVTELSANHVMVSRFEVPASTPGHTVIAFPTPFAEAEFQPAISAASVQLLKGKLVEEVQLVYTTFRVSEAFDQNGLNGSRLKNLYAAVPSVFQNPLTEWEMVAQTGATTPEEGKKYFHGFVITFRPDATPELVKQEMKLLDSLFAPSKIFGGMPPSSYSPSDSVPTEPGKFPAGIVHVLKNPDGSTLVTDHDIPEDSLRFYVKGSPGYDVVYAKYADTSHLKVFVIEKRDAFTQKHTWTFEEHKGEPTFAVSAPPIPDSVVTTVMRRNQWENMVVVTDVTASMSPYTAQIFSWLPKGIASGKCSGFVFFNDGDHKVTSQKNIGRTGGIYATTAMSYDTVFATARKTMAAGDGGDIPENDVEAVLWSIDNIPAGKDIVLIADNWATPRDLELFKKVDHPLHIILCGANGGVNPDYLFLARQTHGSVHTLKNDVYDLDKMQEGEIVKVGFQNFMLHDEHFIAMENFSHMLK